MAEDIDITGSDGKPEMDFELACILNRYATGEAVADIATSVQKSEQYIYARLRELPDDYEKAKTKREQVRGVRLRRIEALADRIVMTRLESIGDDEAKKLPTKDLKRYADIARTYGDKANLAEGKATSIVEDRKEVTADEWKQFWANQQSAGDGLDKESLS
jgi:hypothetical protein